MPKTNNHYEKQSKNGTFSCHFDKETNTKLTLYCKYTNKNKTKFVTEVINKELDERLYKALRGVKWQEKHLQTSSNLRQ